MIDYKENLINENSELNLYDPITKLMKYRMLSNEEMIDRDRCECAIEVCSRKMPQLRKVSENHYVACHLDFTV